MQIQSGRIVEDPAHTPQAQKLQHVSRRLQRLPNPPPRSRLLRHPILALDRPRPAQAQPPAVPDRPQQHPQPVPLHLLIDPQVPQHLLPPRHVPHHAPAPRPTHPHARHPHRLDPRQHHQPHHIAHPSPAVQVQRRQPRQRARTHAPERPRARAVAVHEPTERAQLQVAHARQPAGEQRGRVGRQRALVPVRPQRGYARRRLRVA